MRHTIKNPFHAVESLEVRKEVFTSSESSMGLFSFSMFLVFDLSLISGYNLGVINPFNLKYESASYFGYSIILHETAMIVGAPKDNFSTRGSFKFPHEPGSVWHYNLDNREWKKFVPMVSDEEGYVVNLNMTSRITKERGWFGASMALMGDTLTVCAPRSIWTLIRKSRAISYRSMHGACYNRKISSKSDDFQIYDPNLVTYDFGIDSWAHPIRGFSIHYPYSFNGQTINNPEWIMGCPKQNDSGSVNIENHDGSLYLSGISDEMQFGYAVTSGRFFDANKILYVSGGPRWNYIGQVGIIDPRQNEFNQMGVISRLYGDTIGEYFGASLTSGDMNNDGLDDLIIGAPYYGNDIGRVYIYFGNANGFSEPDVVLTGYSDDGLFGCSVTCGDLDADGFDDVIVGAPYEDGGTIYVYNGGSKINPETVKSSQKVTVSPSVQTFGFSLSKPVDIDANGFPDIGVGAYKTGHAVLLHSRPVVKTELLVSADPQTLGQNSTEFLLKICVTHTERKLPTMKSFDLILNVDENSKRVHKSQLGLTYIHGWNQSSTLTEVCLNTTVHISENVDKNFYDPIDVVIIHKFGLIQKLPNQRIGECKLCPIEVEGASSKLAHLTVPFDLGCGLEKICSAVIELHANFKGNESAWIIGSGDITYEVYITNHGEPAYSTEIVVEIPRGISVRTYSSTWKKHTDHTGLLIITCGVDNPLYINATKKIDFVFDMSQFNNGSVNGTYLDFHVSAKTRSENNGKQNISSSLLLLSHIITTLEGNANDGNYYYTLDDETPNIHFQHSYAIMKSGATPLDKARLCIDVPTKYQDFDLIDLIDEPEVRISGKLYNCSVVDILVYDEEEIMNLTILKNPDNKQLRIIRDTGELPQNIPPRLVPEFNDTMDDHVINLHCLSSNITCGRITCDIPHLEGRKDTAILQLRFLMKLKLLANRIGVDGKKYNISFTTQGWIENAIPFVESKKITRVRTTFRHVEKLKRISIWIIVGSVLLGLLVLFIIATFLWMLGFFKRESKEALEASKTEEETRNPQS